MSRRRRLSRRGGSKRRSHSAQRNKRTHSKQRRRRSRSYRCSGMGKRRQRHSCESDTSENMDALTQPTSCEDEGVHEHQLAHLASGGFQKIDISDITYVGVEDGWHVYKHENVTARYSVKQNVEVQLLICIYSPEDESQCHTMIIKNYNGETDTYPLDNNTQIDVDTNYTVTHTFKANTLPPHELLVRPFNITYRYENMTELESGELDNEEIRQKINGAIETIQASWGQEDT